MMDWQDRRKAPASLPLPQNAFPARMEREIDADALDALKRPPLWER